MTKEEYLKLRNEDDSLSILYNHYTTKFDSKKHKPFLQIDEFVKFMSIWNFQMALENTLTYYDHKFNVTHLQIDQKNIFL